MKNTIKTISVLAVTAIFAASCDVEAVSTIFDSEAASGAGNSVSFVQDVIVDQEIPAAQTTYAISISRVSTDGALTVKLENNLPEAISCPATLTFNSGEAVADLVLDISNMSVGQTFKGTISIVVPEGEEYTFSKLSVSCTLAKAFSWVSIGKGQFMDFFWEGELFDDVEVLKAEGFNIYRFMEPYKDSEYADGDGPEYVLLTVNEDNTATFGTFATPYLYDSSNAVTAYFPSDASSSAAAYDAYNLFLEDYYFALVPYWYVPNVGGWGCKYGYTLFAALPGAPTDLYEWYLANFDE